MLSDREIFISLVDNDSICKSNAIILLEGDGLNRYRHAIDLFKQQYADIIVFSGGITNYEYGSYPYNDIKPYLLQENIPEKKLIHEDKSLNTHEQAVEIVKLCCIYNWRKIILVASHYHQYRAFLTFLKVIQEEEQNIIIYNSPARMLEWFSDNTWGKRIDCLQNEFKKIDEYTHLGHLATYKEAIAYQKWKELQK